MNCLAISPGSSFLEASQSFQTLENLWSCALPSMSKAVTPSLPVTLAGIATVLEEAAGWDEPSAPLPSMEVGRSRLLRRSSANRFSIAALAFCASSSSSSSSVRANKPPSFLRRALSNSSFFFRASSSWRNLRCSSSSRRCSRCLASSACCRSSSSWSCLEAGGLTASGLRECRPSKCLSNFSSFSVWSTRSGTSDFPRRVPSFDESEASLRPRRPAVRDRVRVRSRSLSCDGDSLAESGCGGSAPRRSPGG
mmetsp:Transcript_56190/g.162849  ORF Transcript_56190/g.162849 Transcript_56190/m.162849 type:complete len:252 (-) Transcript_56190:327-1082(-)